MRKTRKEITESPVIFTRTADSQVAHGRDISRPAESRRLGYEREIAVIIGKGGRRISEENAWVGRSFDAKIFRPGAHRSCRRPPWGRAA
ncbi:fumarylacetoacetate hydrolase family protein [Burkholderia latens]|uniref:Fumarylacetoacetase-like C-terminal domain-containing protein n=1 Tax=Burkholderia latens TaxID=488446 RepID=A0A6H9T1S3_9BURK|nr:fumarylacetoacetate hydrolase family protein [Burkholderia latens]KAB0642711.1 hypothetical protein F7R21_10460 [Burkholderia latens]